MNFSLDWGHFVCVHGYRGHEVADVDCWGVNLVTGSQTRQWDYAIVWLAVAAVSHAGGKVDNRCGLTKD